MAEKEDAAPNPESGSPEQGSRTATSSEQTSPVTDIAADLADTKDRLLRCLAEQQNIRRQARRDQENAARYAAAAFAGDLLSSVDDLERAITSVPQDQRTEPVVADLLSGVEATHRALLNTFAKHGLTRFDPLGEAFDPHRHEATFEAADTRYPPGAVVSVIRPGYVYRDRLLRPALVGINKKSDAGARHPSDDFR